MLIDPQAEYLRPNEVRQSLESPYIMGLDAQTGTY
jgi:hypothetical protein